jgi:3-deoxy-manno-octulosonate cytidylyltransferase (CMP-KDO synthetase)
VIVTIPARLASTRLPRKLLLDVGGKPLLWHTVQRALESKANGVYVLAEDEEIRDVVRSWNLKRVEVVLTAPASSGTERIANFVVKYALDDDVVVVNLQGDEPELPGEYIDNVSDLLQSPQCLSAVVTLTTMATPAEARSESVVKVVMDSQAYAMYFSRLPIPFNGPRWVRHVGLYAYRVSFLKEVLVLLALQSRFAGEGLEQLRWLEAGYKILLAPAGADVSVGVDTHEEFLSFQQRYVDSAL